MQQKNDGLASLLATDLRRNFPLLVVQYQQQLYGFAFRQTGNSYDAEEIAQEAFMQAYFALVDYPFQRILELTLQPWLYKITLNVFYKRLRQSRLQLTQLPVQEEEGCLEFPAEVDEQPELLFEKKELRNELEALLMTLPLQYREAVNLYYFAELNYREIADLLQQPLGTVKSNLHRGLSLLRKALLAQQKGR